MLTEETQKKLWLWGMVAVLILGLFWLIFVFWFNRGSIRLEAEPPYRAEIAGVGVETCSENPCVITVAPGEYPVRLIKEGYVDVDLNITVPLGGEGVETVEFQYEPAMSVMGAESELGYFKDDKYIVSEEQAAELKLPERIFTEANFAVYLARNPENGRQTLYYREVLADEGGLGEAAVAASFVRDINEFEIYPFIEDTQKIMLVDKSNDKSVLYLIDLKAKTRDNILEHALINGVKRIPQTETFLYEARDFGSQVSGLFTYNTETGEGAALQVAAALNNVDFIDSNSLFAATRANGYVRYYIDSAMEQSLMQYQTGGEPEQIKLAPDRQAALILIDGTVYELRFAR